MPAWKRKIKRIKIKGEPLSQTVIKNREDRKLFDIAKKELRRVKFI